MCFFRIFTFFWVFWPILANFEAIFNIFSALDSFFWINLEDTFYLTMICTKKWDLNFSTTLVNKCWLNHYVEYGIHVCVVGGGASSLSLIDSSGQYTT